MKIFLVYLLLTSNLIFSQNIPLKKGNWSAFLQLNKNDKLPFKLIINKVNKKTTFSIQNADEIIELTNLRSHQDTIIVDFPTFNSSIHFSIKNNKKITGYWQNYNKGNNYKIEFNANYGYTTRFETKYTTSLKNVNGNWKVKLDCNNPGEYLAIGIFKQSNNKINGTFLTETGDYRYLEGNQFENSFYLSCFDGSHAFLFTAKSQNDSLIGRFLSGNHYQENWNAVKDEKFQLSNPDSLTTLTNNNLFSFQLQDLEGNQFIFPNSSFKNKVVIIQIMGTWCPNCMDETRYYKELYTKYHSQGLEIISVGYEVGQSFEDYSNKLKLLKERLDLNFTFLVGGTASKSLASEQFSMLNEVISFPTSIFIGKDGEVKRVHTGFNGPGTGSYYNEYVEKTNKLIEEMLKL